MGFIIKNWNNIKSSMNLSQKVLDKVKPETSLKNRISFAQKKLQLQITRLDETHQKLQQNHNRVFKKIVDAKLTRNESRAKAYALEVQEIRKVRKVIGEAKLAMEQIQLRLNTVSELGDVVVTLSPCMSLIKGLAPSISGFVPEINTSMNDLSNMLGNMISDSSLKTESILESNQDNADTRAILEEAHAIIEGQVKTNIPEPPSNMINKISTEKEFII
jgi:division protein CdvB (Snf7/Vps24/ESCRT-III family)|tara:strand:- start:372 stop:1025 length:654 start_codon:yes stop_codon:yes gene_type:complete